MKLKLTCSQARGREKAQEALAHNVMYQRPIPFLIVAQAEAEELQACESSRRKRRPNATRQLAFISSCSCLRSSLVAVAVAAVVAATSKVADIKRQQPAVNHLFAANTPPDCLPARPLTIVAAVL